MILANQQENNEKKRKRDEVADEEMFGEDDGESDFFSGVFISYEGFCSSIPHHSYDNHHVLCPEVQMDRVESVHGSDVTEEFFTPGMDFFNWY